MHICTSKTSSITHICVVGERDLPKLFFPTEFTFFIFFLGYVSFEVIQCFSVNCQQHFHKVIYGNIILLLRKGIGYFLVLGTMFYFVLVLILLQFQRLSYRLRLQCFYFMFSSGFLISLCILF